MRSLTLPLIITALCTFLISPSYSQKERTYNWAFPNNRGFNFPAGASPGAVAGRTINNLEGCGAISDASGTLLFYTDGGQIWDAGNTLRQTLNLAGNTETTSSHQNGLVVPHPGSATDYWIFSYSSTKDLFATRYRPSTNTLISGPTRISTENNMAEGLAAVQHSNGTDFWIGSHVGSKAGNPNHHTFCIYPLTAAGVGAEVQYDQGALGNDAWNWTQGGIKFSVNGSLLGFTNAAVSGIIEVYNFNTTSGAIVSNVFSNTGYWSPMGLEFSADGSWLYVIQGFFADDIYQVNTSTGVINYTHTIAGVNNGSLQMGPDCMIYFSRRTSGWIGRIEDPDASGAAATFNNTFYSNANIFYGLPVFVSSYFTDCDVTTLSSTQFTARQDGEKVKLIWDYYYESATNYFEVERSIDGENWEVISTVYPEEISSSQLNFEKFDEDPALGFNYYRLREVLLNEKSSTTSPKMVNFFMDVNDMEVYKTDGGLLKLAAYTDKEANAKLEVFNLIGKRIHFEEIQVPYGHSDFWIDLKGSIPGVYVVRLSYEGSVKTKKIKI